jgi:ABC-type multidrug transport system ATPase subunit
MKIKVENLTKRYNYQVVYKALNYEFVTGKSYAILGPNGSGKSTLVKNLIHYITPTEGKVEWMKDGKKVHIDQIHLHFSIVAPYTEVLEELTLLEFFQFNFKFKKSLYSIKDMIDRIGLTPHRNKAISLFSSGMKQRVKLALNFYADVEVLLFDEPTMNLDEEGIVWYQSELAKIKKERIIIIASNDLKEFDHCDEQINILDYK